MQLSIIQFLIYTIPENLLLIYTSLGLINIKITIQKYITITIIYSVCLIIIRNLFNLYGLHILILCLFLTLLFKFYIKINLSIAIVSSLLGFILLLVGESLILPLTFYYFDIDIKEFINSISIKNIIVFYLTKFPLLISSLIIYFFDFHLFKSESLNKIFNSTNAN